MVLEDLGLFCISHSFLTRGLISSGFATFRFCHSCFKYKMIRKTYMCLKVQLKIQFIYYTILTSLYEKLLHSFKFKNMIRKYISAANLK